MLADHRYPKKSIQYATCPFKGKIIVHGLAKVEMSYTGLASVLYGKCRVWEISKGFSRNLNTLVDCFSQEWKASVNTLIIFIMFIQVLNVTRKHVIIYVRLKYVC